jgi:predicted GIY-YIG superfamily endonuclease
MPSANSTPVPASHLSPQCLVTTLTAETARVTPASKAKGRRGLSGVYCLFAKANPAHIRYVGSSIDIEHRFWQHVESVGARLGEPLACAVLELTKFTSRADRDGVEGVWIKTLRKHGHADLNRALT